MTATVSLDPSGDPSGRSDLQNLLNAISAIPPGSITIAPAGFANTPSGPQRKTILISQPASGGTYNYTMTWPHPSSGSNSAPKILWAGGSAPTMSTGQGATDLYELTTLDGATWVGRAVQNVS